MAAIACALPLLGAQQPTSAPTTAPAGREHPPLLLTGVVVPQRRTLVPAEVEGVVAEYKVQEGQFVDPGDVLCRLNNTVANFRLDEARAALEAVEEQLKALASAGDARPEELVRLRSQVTMHQVAVRRAIRDVNKTEIRAPFAGAIVSRRTEAGAWVAVGDAVAELVAIDAVRVRIDVPESALGRVKVGTSVEVEIGAAGQTLSAAIARLIPDGDASSHTLPIEIDLPNEQHTLLPGMSAVVTIAREPTAASRPATVRSAP